MNSADRDKIISCYPVLQELSPDLQRKIDQTVKLVQAPAGRRLFDEGSPCSIYPLLVDGVIRATKSSPDGHEILLYRLKPGESCVITCVALLGESPYPAIGAAETDLSLYGVPRGLFLEMILKSDPFRVFVFQFLSQRMAHLMALIDDVAFRRVDQRLASRLLRHPEPLTVTHQMLADELGTTREVVSRTLESFQESGMLKLGRKRIEILNRTALDRVHRAEATSD
jgi:CRP/FNR family transcriptional regulator